MKLLKAAGDDIYANLALEEWLFDELPPEDWRLLLTVNRPCVVVGKHQNPWRETSPALLRRAELPLARRISGGGTVFHDLGNLNYSVMVPRDRYRQEAIQEMVLAGIRSLGIPAELGERHILTLGGRKFSGNAFCFRRGKVLHHGTLLVHADLAALRRVATPAETVVEGRGIASVPSPVINLCEARDDLTLEQVAEAVARSAAACFGVAFDGLSVPVVDEEAVTAIRRRQESWAWQYGETPAFGVTWQTPGGELLLRIRDGLVAEAAGTGGGEALVGCRFEYAELAAAARDDGQDALASWIEARDAGVTV